MSDEQRTSLDEIFDGKDDLQPAPEPVAEEVAVEPVEEQAAEATPEPEVTPEPTPKPEPDMVPVGVVQELRRELRELKQAQQPRQQAPDPIDPDYARHIEQQMVQRDFQNAARIEKLEACLAHGADTVNAAFKAAEAAGMIDTLGTQPNAWEALVKWHKQETVRQEVGDDPAAYRQRLEAEIRQKLEAEMVAKQTAALAGTPAPSLASATGTGGGPKSTWTGPTPLNNILGD